MPDKYKRASLTVTLGDGTKKTLRFTGKTQKEADKKKAKAKAEYEAGLLIINSKTTVQRWYQEWLEVYKKPKVQDCTIKEIEGIMRRVYLPYIGNVKLCDLRAVHLQKCINMVAGKSDSYISKCHIYISEMLKQAPEGTLKFNPLKGLEKPFAKKNIPRRPLTIQEREIFLKTLKTHPKGAFFGIMYACGLRPQEARALSILCVNIEKAEIKITRAVESGTNREIKGPKSESGNRIIPIPSWYIPILTEALQEAVKKNSAYVFSNRNGEIIGINNLYRAWHSFLRAMDICAGAETSRNKIIIHAIDQNITPYYLRHTYCTELAEKGVDLKTAQYLMGHSDIRITAGIYTHVTDSMLEVAREKINTVNFL